MVMRSAGAAARRAAVRAWIGNESPPAHSPIVMWYMGLKGRNCAGGVAVGSSTMAALRSGAARDGGGDDLFDSIERARTPIQRSRRRAPSTRTLGVIAPASAFITVICRSKRGLRAGAG